MAPSLPLPPATEPAGVYRCGTLTYTKRLLGVLFFWLLWGDFCYVLMEAVVPSLMPLRLKALHASDTFIGMILVTIPMMINTVFNPVISFRSDRYRSRWGRRIPFILFTLPLLVLCLLGLGFADSAGFWLRGAIAGLEQRFSANAVALGVIGLAMILFSFFNTFVNSVFWYLFNDVVPDSLLARFMSWFRIVSLGSTSLYNLFIFPRAETHFRLILCGASAVYFVGFGLMCLNVREGEYPPPTPNVDGSVGLKSAVKTFARECHSHWHYWYVFMGSAFAACSNAMLTFMLFFYQSTGLNLTQIGRVQGITSIVAATMILGSGWLADRFHPIRVVLVGQILQVLIVLPAMCVWLFWHPASHVAFWGWMVLSVGLAAPVSALVSVCDPPLLMRMLPRENFGQFCAANAMWRSLGYIVGGSAAGIFLDLMRRSQGEGHAYAFIPVWQWVFSTLVVWFSFRLFRSWKRYGGDRDYQPPVPDAWTVLSENIPEPIAITGTGSVLHSSATAITAAHDGETP